jgi:hypothetical protein
MAFWIGILVAGTFAWSAIKLGFYETFALVFNIIISIYLAIYLRPIIVNIPVVGDTPCSNALSMVAVALASFLILQGISYTFLIGQINVSFPKVFDTLGAGLLGFLGGFLVWSFLSLLIYVTPASRNTFVKGIGFKDEFQQTTVSYVCRFCNLVNAIVSQDEESSAEQTISELLKGTEPKVQKKPPEEPEPVKSAKPSNAETSTTEAEEKQPGPSPEIGI